MLMLSYLLPAAMLLGVLASVPATAATLYVSPHGNDANTGLGPEKGQALRSIQAAVDKLQPGDTCLILEGVYRETVTFPRSGAPGKPITVKPYRNAKVTISGCEPVTGWTQDAGGVWKAPMPWTLGTGRNQVFAGGQVMIEARHPNTPDEGLGMYVSGLSPLWPTFGEFSIPNPKENAARITSKHLEGQPDDHWKGALYYGVHFEGWAAQTGVVESSKSGEIIVGDRTQGWWFGSAYGGNYSPEEGRGMIVGHRNALDQHGEWHWQEDTLTLIPRDGKQPAAVEAKRRQLAFDLSGREHIHLEGLNVHAASMKLEDSAHCVVDGCRLSHISHYTRHYNIGQVEQGRDTLKSGETGIFVGGHDNAFLNCSVRVSAGAGFYLRGYHHTIHNCLIDEVSYTAHYLNAITDAVSDYNDYENFLVGGHVITYNTMRNAGRHFFNFYGNGTSTASRDRGPMDYMATLFAHNHLYNGMLQTRDAGFLTGYYSSGGTLNGLNSQVAYNAMHDCYDTFGMRINVLGIVYLDAGTCDVDLYNNLLWAAPGSHQRGLWYNTMCVDVHERDNVFHPMFERAVAELNPADFPGGKPFRFGHDFDDPPPPAEWPPLEKRRIEAESAPERSAGASATAKGIGGLKDGDWVQVGEVDFDAGWQSAVMRFASDAKEMNTDRSTRARPRHRHATDPLVLEAIHNDGTQEKVRKQWTFVYSVQDGAWLRFNQVPLGEGYRRFRVIYGNDQAAPRRVEVRLDAVDGPLVGEVALPQTDKSRGGRIQIYAEATGAISPEAKGTHDVFLVCRSEDGLPVGEFEYFRFEQYRGAIPLQKNDVKLELRIDARDGEKIGEFHPRFTGNGAGRRAAGAESFRDLVATLEPVRGKHPLYVVARSALGGPLGTIDWLSLEKAKQPGAPMAGIGAPPLVKSGRMVLPEVTNRPCARPADKYPKRVAGAPSRPRAITTAAPLTAKPAIDGRLDEWPADDAQTGLTLSESYDGSLSAGPPSRAWIGYDGEAMVIAMRHPVKNAAALLPSTHVWGQVDGVEVAFQDAFARKPGSILTLYGYPDGRFTSEDYGGATQAEIARLEKGVTYKAQVGKEEWTCEWRIPFAACGFTPKSAPMLLLNLGVRKAGSNAWVVWRGTGGANYQVANAGMLVFPAEMLAAGLPAEGLEVRLDASDAESLVVEEGKVAAWKDRSGKGRDARQANPAFRPTLEPDALYGKPALRFDEKLKTRLELPDLSGEKMSATLFAVASNPVAGDPVNHNPRIFTTSDGKEFDYLVGLCLSVHGMETGGPRVLSSAATDRWAKSVRVGCFSPNPQTFFTGHIAEILVYSRVMPPGEQERVRAYLAAKWGLRQGG